MTDQRLTLAQVASYPRPGMAGPAAIGFTPDSRALTWLWSASGGLVRSLWRVELDTDARRVILGPDDDPAELSREEELRRERTRTRELGVTSYSWARDAEPAVCLIPGGPRLRVLVGDGDPRELPNSEAALEPALSPNGKFISFVRDGDLHVLRRESGELIRLTSEAEDGLTFGLADYIAQEEFGQLRGHWWSRDSRHLALVRVDARNIPEYPIVHQGLERPEVEHHRYPFAGDANAELRLGVISAEGGGVQWLNLPDQDDEEDGEEDGYLVRVAWWPQPNRPEGRLVAQWLNREQNRLRLFAWSADGERQTLIDERRQPWINIGDEARGLDDGSFLWADEAGGWRHLSLRNPDGSAARQLTDGEWIVTDLIGVDQPRGWVYFSATRESPLQRHVYRVSLQGGEPQRLTEVGGVQGGALSPDGDWLATMGSSLQRPPWIAVQPTDDAAAAPRILFEQPDTTPDSLGLAPPNLQTFRAADGAQLFGALYQPPDRDGDQPPPLLVAVYGGPHAQTVLDAWGLTVDLRAQYLAQQGYLVLKLDNRGMAGRGLDFEAHLHRRMGTIEVDDQAAAVEQLAADGQADPARVGVYGWSYGGYMTVMSMLRRPDLFRVGVAGAPVADWDGYDTGYTERYMATPQTNAEGYREASLLTHADRLQGKLLLVHGGIDENVHFRHTARLITALTAADKDYDLLLFPQERHMPRDAAGLEYQERKLAEHFDQHLRPDRAAQSS